MLIRQFDHLKFYHCKRTSLHKIKINFSIFRNLNTVYCMSKCLLVYYYFSKKQSIVPESLYDLLTNKLVLKKYF